MTLAPPQPPGVGRAPHFIDYIKREVGELDELGAESEDAAHPGVHRRLHDRDDARPEALRRHGGGRRGPPRASPAIRSPPSPASSPGDGAVSNLFGGLDYVATQFGYADRGRTPAGFGVQAVRVSGGAARRDRSPQRLRRQLRAPDPLLRPAAGQQLRRRGLRRRHRRRRRHGPVGQRRLRRTRMRGRRPRRHPGRHRRRHSARTPPRAGRGVPGGPRPGREPAGDGRRLRHVRLRRASTPSRTASRRSGTTAARSSTSIAEDARRAFEANEAGVLNVALQRVVGGVPAGPPASAGRWRERPARRRTTSTPGSSATPRRSPRPSGSATTRPGR